MSPILSKFVLWAQTQVKERLKSTLMAEDMAPFVLTDGTTGYVGMCFFPLKAQKLHIINISPLCVTISIEFLHSKVI